MVITCFLTVNKSIALFSWKQMDIFPFWQSAKIGFSFRCTVT